ncbi:hypothetical protein Tco_0900832 [Tanacetum coccineum]
MVASRPSNVIARRVVDDLIDFSGEAVMPKFMKFFFVQQIADIPMDDQEEEFDTLMCVRDDIRDENNKLMDLNVVIAQAEERITIKEEHMKVMEAAGCSIVCGPLEMVLLRHMRSCEWQFSADGAINLSGVETAMVVPCLIAESYWLFSLPFDAPLNDQSWKLVTKCKGVREYLEYICGLSFKCWTLAAYRLQDKIKVVFSEARSEDESFIGLMCDLCSRLRLSLTKNWWLIAELEALGQRGDALRSLEYMREIVVYDSATLGVLEQLLASTHVGMRLKAGYAADMDEAE